MHISHFVMIFVMYFYILTKVILSASGSKYIFSRYNPSAGAVKGTLSLFLALSSSGTSLGCRFPLPTSIKKLQEHAPYYIRNQNL